jgi:radical SAM superfamily enzyme with C-terminal helix-hairpin-helix motif
MDNANPGTLFHHPQESRQIAKIIIRYHTPGDVAALGIESVDPEVIKRNNLKVSADEALKAIELLNSVGAQRGTNGLPELLPGLNFLAGLPGETKETYDLNYRFLDQVKKKGLLVRRINLRQVISFPVTQDNLGKQKKVSKKFFHDYKEKIRVSIDQPLLIRMLPPGTLLRTVYAETHHGNMTFLRHMGTYPLLVGVPAKLPLRQKYRIMVTSHGYRSVTGVPFPLNVNTASLGLLNALPGIGMKRAQRIITKRPFSRTNELCSILDDPAIVPKILPYITV